MIPKLNYIWSAIHVEPFRGYDYIGSIDRKDSYLKGSVCGSGKFRFSTKYSGSSNRSWLKLISNENVSHIRRYKNYLKDCEEQIQDILE